MASGLTKTPKGARLAAMQTFTRNQQKETGEVDLMKAVERQVADREFRFIQYRFGWLLVVFYSSGIVDHPLREAANDEGKAELEWWMRKHEVIGIGRTPAEAAADILAGKHGARFVGFEGALVGEQGKRLLFRHLDNNWLLTPDEAVFLARLPPAS